MTTTLLTFLAIWWISGNQWDWKKTKLGTSVIFMLKEGYGSRHMEREEFEWSQFDCHSQLDWDRRVAVGWILLLQIHITTHPICSTPSFYSEEETNIWRCRRMSEWCEEVIAGWKPNRYWQNRLQPADASQRKEMQRRGCGSIYHTSPFEGSEW